MLKSTFRAAAMFALFNIVMNTAAVQDVTCIANPPRVLIKSSSASRLSLPACATSNPSVPTPGVLYCYTPSYIWTAYDIQTFPDFFRAGVPEPSPERELDLRSIFNDSL